MNLDIIMIQIILIMFFEQVNKRFHSLGLTSNSETKDKTGTYRKNMKLNKNPEKNKTTNSYIRYGIITAHIGSYSKKPSKKFNFDNEDFKLVKSKIRNYKNYRRKK